MVYIVSFLATFSIMMSAMKVYDLLLRNALSILNGPEISGVRNLTTEMWLQFLLEVLILHLLLSLVKFFIFQCKKILLACRSHTSSLFAYCNVLCAVNL